MTGTLEEIGGFVGNLVKSMMVDSLSILGPVGRRFFLPVSQLRLNEKRGLKGAKNWPLAPERRSVPFSEYSVLIQRKNPKSLRKRPPKTHPHPPIRS